MAVGRLLGVIGARLEEVEPRRPPTRRVELHRTNGVGPSGGLDRARACVGRWVRVVEEYLRVGGSASDGGPIGPSRHLHDERHALGLPHGSDGELHVVFAVIVGRLRVVPRLAVLRHRRVRIGHVTSSRAGVLGDGSPVSRDAMGVGGAGDGSTCWPHATKKTKRRDDDETNRGAALHGQWIARPQGARGCVKSPRVPTHFRWR